MAAVTGLRNHEMSREAINIAQRFEGIEGDTKSYDILNVIKRIKRSLGLNGTDIEILEKLFLFSQKQDWVEGARPIVWPSNFLLSEETGIEIRSIQRSLSKLVRKCLIAPKDSPTGKRYGRRTGGIRTSIVEGYGFDLSPLAVRYEEFLDLHDQQKAIMEHYRSINKRITIAKKSINMIINAAIDAGLAGDWIENYSDTTKRSKDIDDAQKTLSALLLVQEELNEAYNIAIKTTKMTRQRDKNVMHIENTTDINISICNENVSKRNCSTEQSSIYLKIAKRDLMGMQKNSVSNLMPQQEENSSEPIKLSYGLVKKACPEFQNYLKGETVADYMNAAETVRIMLGVSKDGWLQAQNAMGQNQSIVAIAIMLENFEKINNHGGYLRGMTKKAVAGDLNLVGSLIGLVQ
ncbi:MAG: hypothetical protein HRU28_03940 [Rhizobiales bacterium]|nr:hypothetical protein [Hyphomicrobiales bacterium]